MNLLRASLLRACVGAGLVVAWSACSSDGGGGPPVPTASALTVDAGNNQVGTAGQALGTALSVIARDASSNPVAGVTVTWAAATGGGSVSPTTSSTNASGIASTTRTLGAAAGTHTTSATVTGVAPVTFSAVGQIQGATQMALSAGNNQTDTVLATLSVPLAVVVRDQNSAAVAGVVVNWSATGGGTVSAATSTTNASGVATITRTLGPTAGAQGAQATVTGLAGSPVTFALTATAGNAAVLVKTAGDNQSVAPSGQVLYTVTARDAHTNPKNGVTIDWAVGTGGGSITPASNVTGVNGTASATRTLSANLGAHTATATAAGLGGSPATFTTTAVNVAAVSVGGAATAFNPANVTIPLNGIVTWTWAAGNALPHNVTFNPMAGMPANIPNTVTPGTAVDRTFTVAGTFMYQCTNHLNMNGQVTVTP